MDRCWKAGDTTVSTLGPDSNQIVSKQPLAGHQLSSESELLDGSWSTGNLELSPIIQPGPLSSPSSEAIFSPDKESQIGYASSWSRLPDSDGFAMTSTHKHQLDCESPLQLVSLQAGTSPTREQHHTCSKELFSNEIIAPRETEVASSRGSSSTEEALEYDSNPVRPAHTSEPKRSDTLSAALENGIVDSSACATNSYSSCSSPKARQAVLCASNAMSHLLTNEERIFKVFELHGVHRDNLDLTAGFDEAIFSCGVGPVERVFISCNAELTDSLGCLQELGKVLSPFVGLLETATHSFMTSVFENGGMDRRLRGFGAERFGMFSSAERDSITATRNVFFAQAITSNNKANSTGNSESHEGDSGSDANGHCAEGMGDNPNMPNNMERKSHVGEGQGENPHTEATGEAPHAVGNNENQNGGVVGRVPPVPPSGTNGGTIPSVFFQCIATISTGEYGSTEATHIQTVQTSGSLTYEVIGDVATSNTSRVKFSHLELQGFPDSDAASNIYDITHTQVVINSLEERTWCSEMKPETTPSSEFESKVKHAKTEETTLIMSATGSGESSTTQEQVSFPVQVLKYHMKGKIWWLCSLDDINYRLKLGLPQKVNAYREESRQSQSSHRNFSQDLLPKVEFLFFAEERPPPRETHVKVTSLRTVTKKAGTGSRRPCYHNIVHWVELVVPSMPPGDTNHQVEARMSDNIIIPFAKAGEPVPDEPAAPVSILLQELRSAIRKWTSLLKDFALSAPALWHNFGG